MQHAGEGDDEGGDTEVSDPEAVERADERARRRGSRPAPAARGRHWGTISTPEIAPANGHRADREVDVAGDDDQDHADGEDQDVAVLHEQVGDVVGRSSTTVR